jgi:hypothetical protein
VETEEKQVVDVTTSPTTLPATSTVASEPSSLATATARFSSFNRGSRPNNLAFLGRKPADLISTTSTAVPAELTSTSLHIPTTDHGLSENDGGNDAEITTTPLNEVGSTTPVSGTSIRSQPGATAARFPLKAQLANNNFPSGLPGRSRNFQVGRKEVEKGTTAVPSSAPALATTVGLVKTTTEAASTTADIKILSVESILTDDDSENELDSNDNDDNNDLSEVEDTEESQEGSDQTQEEEEDEEEEDEDEKDMGESRNFEKKTLTKLKPAPVAVPSVKKALGPPLNANIRVEFKKASALLGDTLEGEEGTKKFFVKPDGRKPRVKSNIR